MLARGVHFIGFCLSAGLRMGRVRFGFAQNGLLGDCPKRAIFGEDGANTSKPLA
jgi:hypothetical protein